MSLVISIQYTFTELEALKPKTKSNHNDDQNYRDYHLTKSEHVSTHLDAKRIEFVKPAVICVVFAVSFAHLEYYYSKDPALQTSNGKVQVDDPNFDRSGETKPLIGNLYQYHLFPMLFIFILISFAALFDGWTSMHLGALDAGSFVISYGCVIAIVIATSASLAHTFLHLGSMTN